MLKISITDTDQRHRLIVEGKLIAPWAAELRKVCQRPKADLQGGELLIELKDLTVISQEGENVLLELMDEGIRLRGYGVFTKHILRELAKRRHMTSPEATS